MSDREKAKKLAAAKKKLKQYQSKEKHTDVDSSDTSEYGGSSSRRRDVWESQSQCDEPGGKKLDDANRIDLNLQQETTRGVEGSNAIQQPSNEIVTNSISDYFNNTSTFQSIEFDIQPNSTSDTVVEPTAVVAMPPPPPPLLPSQPTTVVAITQDILQPSSVEKSHVNAMEILIAEKASLSAELTKQQTLCKEKTLEAEELMVQLQMSTNRNRVLENEVKELHSQNSTLKINLDDVSKRFEEQKYEIDKQKLKCNELTEYLDELKQELNKETQKNQKLEKELKEKLCELELSHIRINQISDETNLVADNRVEALTQTKFMYEQQISDLQAMVQQLTTERDQANQQYQNYVQHLNKEMTNISEKNSELITENEGLANRERQLIEHIGSLEKQIQENIAKQENLKEKLEKESSIETSTFGAEKLKLEKEIENLINEKSTLEKKIQLQENKIQELSSNLLKQDDHIIKLEEKIENILSERPNNEKLLATIESDKIAASRALIQNDELKKQLDEVQQKLIQITNDKVELINLLDSEQYKNRKIHENYDEMENKLKEMQETLHFKDEEMIRLTHEHNELNKTILQLNQRIDRLMHYEAKEYMRQKQEVVTAAMNQMNDDGVMMNLNSISNNGDGLGNGDHHCDQSDGHDHDHSNHHHHQHHDHEHEHEHGDHSASNNHHDHSHGHDHSHETRENSETDYVGSEECPKDSQIQIESDSAKIHKKMPLENNSSNRDEIVDRSPKTEHYCNDDDHNIQNHGIPTHEAMEKLQQRFRKIMLDVADLTDEKQRLEHLVGQLQLETETIGEYITLYQTQRRLLKQREIEKSTQLRILLTEREEMKAKITNLTQLVENLVAELSNNQIQFETKAIVAATANKSMETATTTNNGYSEMDSIPKIPSTNDNSDPYTIQQQQQNKNFDLQMNTNLNSNQNHPLLMKIHNIIAEIKEQDHNLEASLKFVPSVDHCACCSGKYEII